MTGLYNHNDYLVPQEHPLKSFCGSSPAQRESFLPSVNFSVNLMIEADLPRRRVLQRGLIFGLSSCSYYSMQYIYFHLTAIPAPETSREPLMLVRLHLLTGLDLSKKSTP